MVRLINLLLILLTLTLGMVFANANPQPVRLDYYFGSTELPLAWVVAIVLACGAMLGALAMGIHLLRLQRIHARLKRQLRLLQEELNKLRVMPIKDR
jgi:lipopolysaccharide assembly protein A